MRVSSLSLAILLAGCVLAASIYLARASDPSKTREPLAVVAGQTIYEDELLPLVQAQVRNQEYELKSKTLENLVNQKLEEAEAKKMGIPVAKLLTQEVDAKVPDPTQAELMASYQSQKDNLHRPFEEVKTQLQQAVKQARLPAARQEYLEHLRQQAGVSILLRPPRVEVGYDRARLRGSLRAPVIIVEFADYQCPFCRQVEPTLETLVAKYEGRVSLAYRDFPLRQIHPQAQLAAEASRCAGDQGKFWEYHDLLFAKPEKLNRAGFVEHARNLQLDEKQFDSCLSNGKYTARIEEDLQEGVRAGVEGTPGFFINGSFLSGAQPAGAFDALIRANLAPRKTSAPFENLSNPVKPQF